MTNNNLNSNTNQTVNSTNQGGNGTNQPPSTQNTQPGNAQAGNSLIERTNRFTMEICDEIIQKENSDISEVRKTIGKKITKYIFTFLKGHTALRNFIMCFLTFFTLLSFVTGAIVTYNLFIKDIVDSTGTTTKFVQMFNKDDKKTNTVKDDTKIEVEKDLFEITMKNYNRMEKELEELTIENKELTDNIEQLTTVKENLSKENKLQAEIILNLNNQIEELITPENN